MTTVGVIGAGVMGVGVTQSLMEHGHQAVVVDVDVETLDRAREEVGRNLRFARLLASDADRTVQSAPDPVYTTDLARLEKVDFLVENVTEDWEVKRGVWERADEVCAPHCVFAANTSAISITRLAGLTGRPEQVVGMHFMNPVPMKDTVEVIRGWHTSEATLATARGFLQSIGKEGIVVNDVPGFVSNRVLMLTINEAVFVVQDGVATAEEVDLVFRSCFGHKMGPLETADLIGLDTILHSVEVLYESFNDSKYRPSPLLKKMVAAGLLGRKSGAGFHSYA